MHHTEIGYNSRLDSLQAAVLRIAAARARRLERGAPRGRRALRERRRSASTCSCHVPTEDAKHVYHLYVVALG